MDNNQNPQIPQQPQGPYQTLNNQQTPYQQPVSSQPQQPYVPAQPPTNGPGKPKKPFYKRWWFITLCIIVGLSILVGVFGENEPTPPDPVDSLGVSDDSTDNPVSDDVLDESDTLVTLSPEELSVAIKNVLLENFENVEVSYDSESDMFTISIWSDGIAAAVALHQTGSSDFSSEWEGMKTNFVSLNETIVETVSLAGYDSSVNLQLKNDINTDLVLLSVFNGVVIYDVLA